jgi:hypothetical protein
MLLLGKDLKIDSEDIVRRFVNVNGLTVY